MVTLKPKYRKGQTFTEVSKNNTDLVEIMNVNHKDGIYECRLTYDGQCEIHGDSYPFECNFQEFELNYQLLI